MTATQNSRKHGLFAANFTYDDAGLSPELAELAGYLASLSAGRLDLGMTGQHALFAAAQAERAAELLCAMRSELDALLASACASAETMLKLLVQIARLGRYQRRFRGQRDRAMRALMKEGGNLSA